MVLGAGVVVDRYGRKRAEGVVGGGGGFGVAEEGRDYYVVLLGREGEREADEPLVVGD